MAGDDASDGAVVEVDDEDDGEQQAVAGEPVSHLPFDGEAPDGYKMVPAECDANADALAAAEEAGEIEMSSTIVFAVLEDWDSYSKGGGGSGGVTGTNVDLGFRTESGDVKVAFEWENRNQDGEIIDANGDPWKSFDYESNYNGSTTTVEYGQAVSGVSVGDQSVDIFYRDPSQAPDRFDGEEYVARVSAFDLPNSPFMTASGIDEYSLVFTITFDSDNSEVDQGVIESIIGSINMPTCVWDEMLLSEEPIREVDLNGDGEVMTMEEWQAEMMKEIDDMREADDDD